MTAAGAIFLGGSSIAAGAVNAIAGGGSLLSFPAAIAAGLSPIVANATNAVGVIPGSFTAAWSFRSHLAGLGKLTAALCVPAVLGSVLGAAILRHTPQRLFDGVVPWLVLGATIVILCQEVLAQRRRRRPAAPSPDIRGPGGAPPPPGPGRQPSPHFWGLQFLVSVYGGYFGAAMGLIMLAFLSFLPQHLGLHQINAVKNVLAVVINATAAVDFISHGLVRPLPALLMAGGTAVGGVVGGRLALRVPPRLVRALVIAIGLSIATLLAWHHYKH
jgi:uncharacterized membrane protein YfcA